ncbi:serine/threonine-protein kinase 31-like [Amphiura filiformis]|uniref:serine/threonine-protein kinase 31-like n=1 Tax=Amphiura filiformis TaxID=82378 RepID=UPI003B21EFFF
MVARNEARQETFQAITSFLSKTKSLPLVDRQEKVKPTSGPPLALLYHSEDVSIALECLEAEYFDLLAADKDATAAKEDSSQIADACIQEYTQWKTDKCSYLSSIRTTTDNTLTLWTSLLAKLLLSFGLDRDEDVEPVESTDELIETLMVAIDTELYMSQKSYTPVVKLDPSLLQTKQQKETIKAGVLTKTVCCLTKELRRELASIETLTELYNHHEQLGKELEPWMNSKPDVSEMQTVQKDIKGLRSRLRHKLADKHDMDEAPELCDEKNKESLNDELGQIRSGLQEAYATEDKLLVGLAGLTKRHFPELALLHPTFRIKDYLETNGLLKHGRDLQQFDLQPLPSTKSSIVKSGQFNGQNIVIKSYNISSEDMRTVLLHNAIAYSKLDIDRLLHIQLIIPTSELSDQLHFQLPQLPLNLVRTVKETTPTALHLQTIFKDIVTGLKALHGLDVIHGALHPENILVTEDMHAMLADYDFSKTPTERAQQGYKTDNGLHFTAPEINCGLEAHVASDMFALGVSLLFAHYPETAFTMQPDGTPDLTAITIKPELRDIIKKLISYGQGKRPHSPAVLASEYLKMDIQKLEEEEQKRKEEEQRIKDEEEKKREEEEQRKKEELQKKIEEEERKQQEEEQKCREEQERKEAEQTVKIEEQEVSVKEEKNTEDDDDGPPALETEEGAEEEEVDINQNMEAEIKKEKEEDSEQTPSVNDDETMSQGVESSL